MAEVELILVVLVAVASLVEGRVSPPHKLAIGQLLNFARDDFLDEPAVLEQIKDAVGGCPAKLVNLDVASRGQSNEQLEKPLELI